MLVWINGPFGVGKTQTAHELHRRLPGSVICDPEHVGFGLHRTMPAELRGDFQDLPAWRQGVVEVLERTLVGQHGPVIVPMTVIEPAYFAETVGRLRDAGHDVRHFALLARPETVRKRLRGRGFGHALGLVAGRNTQLGREGFALSKLDLGLARLALPQFAEQLWTDDRTVAQVVDHIAARTGLTLRRNTDSALHGRVRRGWVSLRHIRLR